MRHVVHQFEFDQLVVQQPQLPAGLALGWSRAAQGQQLRFQVVIDLAAGRHVARESLMRTGLTHRGKESLGRPVKTDAGEVAWWRREGGASLARTAAHWGLSLATDKRYCSPTKSPA